MNLRCVMSLALCWPVCALAAQTTVASFENDAKINQNGVWITAQVGMKVEAGSAATGTASSLQLRMADGALLALPADSEIAFGDSAALRLVRGGLRLSTAQSPWLVQALGRNLRASGSLKLQSCAEGCALQPGIYGRANGGETIAEYEGGRSVLKNKVFRLLASGTRPEIMARAPALLDGATNHAKADVARAEVARRLSLGQEAFQKRDFAAAKEHLEAVQAAAPSESAVSYYLGLIALDSQDNSEALRLLQKYMKDDPQAAIEREVPKTITLLSTQQLQEEVASAIVQEKALSTSPPEPNSIAVQTFSSRGDPIYQAMAKGIAAMIIADLSNIPGLKVLEREKVQKLMAEIALGESGLAESSTAVRTGRMMRAEKVIVGSFGVKQ